MSQIPSTPPPPSPSKLKVPKAPRHGPGYEDSEPYPTRQSARLASQRTLKAADRGSPQLREFTPDEDRFVSVVEALPTPTKTPAKKKAFAPSDWPIGPSIDRSLFRTEKRMALSRSTDKLEIFTDSRDRIPEASSDARNPFSKTTRPSDGEASTASRQARSSVREKDSSSRDDDVKYMFRGKQVTRPAHLSDYDSDEDEEDDEDYLGLFASRRDLLPDHAESKWKALRRRDVKPKMLWPQDPSQSPKDANDDSLFTPKSSVKGETKKTSLEESEQAVAPQSATRARGATRRGTRSTEMNTVVKDNESSAIQSRNNPKADASSTRSLRPSRGSKIDSLARYQTDGAGDLPDSQPHGTQGPSQIDGADEELSSGPGPVRSSPFKKWLRKKNATKEAAPSLKRAATSGEDAVPTKRTRAAKKDV